MSLRISLRLRTRLPFRQKLAERAGFEPAVPFWGTYDFQSYTFGHSVTSPGKSGGGRPPAVRRIARIHYQIERAGTSTIVPHSSAGTRTHRVTSRQGSRPGRERA